MSEIAKFAGANLPAVTSLTAALRSLEVAAPSATARLISSDVATFPLVLPASAPRLEPVSGAARRNDTSPGRLNTNTTRSPALTPNFRRTATGIVT